MKTSSAKAKGRRLQDLTRALILKYLNFSTNDVKTAIMGEQGRDVHLSSKAFKGFPYAIECKNQERLNIWSAYNQASKHGKGEPLLVISRNRQKPLAVVDLEYFIKLHRK